MFIYCKLSCKNYHALFYGMTIDYCYSEGFTLIATIQDIVTFDTEYMTAFPSLSLKMLLGEATEKEMVRATATMTKFFLMFALLLFLTNV